jgi:UrcA family protein
MNATTSTSLRSSLVAGAILGALALSFATVSSAEESTTPPQAIVKFGDLDISTPQGAIALYGRIRSAADRVCWPKYSSDNVTSQLNNACMQQVIAEAVMEVNRPALSAVYEAKYGKLPTFALAMNQGR